MLCLAALAFCRCDDKRVTVGDLTVEMLENPVGLDERTPRFGWQLRSDLRDVAQTSYRIVVAGSENDLKKEQNLIWDSGEVPSGNRYGSSTEVRSSSPARIISGKCA